MPPEEHNTLNFSDMVPKPVGDEPQHKHQQALDEANALLNQPAAPTSPQSVPTSSAAQQTAEAAVSPPSVTAPVPVESTTPPQLNPLAQLQQTESHATSSATTASPQPVTPEVLSVAATPAQPATAPQPAAVASTVPASSLPAEKASRLGRYTWLSETADKLHLRQFFNKTILKYILIGVISIGIFVLVFNFPIILADIRYKFAKPQPQPAISTQASLATANVVGPNPEVIVPKLNVTAPIQFPPTLDETQIEVALRDGVVHYAGTALPGERGNVVIFGHSSNDWWQPGNYKFIFALLDRLSTGDTVQVNYQSHRYVYQVTGTKVVDPNDFSVVQPTDVPTLTLITCTPPGTSWKRLVVTAKQIEPTPNNQAVTTNAAITQPKSLPSDAPSSIWTKVTNFWHNIF